MKIGEMRDVRHPMKSTSSAQKGAGEAGKRGEVDDEGDKAQNKSPLRQGVKEGEESEEKQIPLLATCDGRRYGRRTTILLLPGDDGLQILTLSPLLVTVCNSAASSGRVRNLLHLIHCGFFDTDVAVHCLLSVTFFLLLFSSRVSNRWVVMCVVLLLPIAFSLFSSSFSSLFFLFAIKRWAQGSRV